MVDHLPNPLQGNCFFGKGQYHCFKCDIRDVRSIILDYNPGCVLHRPLSLLRPHHLLLPGHHVARGVEGVGPFFTYFFNKVGSHVFIFYFFLSYLFLKRLAHMFTPKMDKLLLPTVWLDAANQVRLKIFLHSSHADCCWQTFERGHSDAKQIKFCLSGFQLRSLSGLLLLWPCLWLDHKLWQLQQPRQELRQGRDHHHRLQRLHGHLRLRGHLLHPWLQGGSPL